MRVREILSEIEWHNWGQTPGDGVDRNDNGQPVTPSDPPKVAANNATPGGGKDSTTSANSEDKLVIVFKGMHGDQFKGNMDCATLAQKLNGVALQYTQIQNAQQLIAQKKPKFLYVIGYSKGASTAIQLSKVSNPPPTLTILIAPHAGELSAIEGSIRGPYVNYYNPDELNGQVKGGYKPKGGTPKTSQAGHADIVQAVTSDIVSRVNAPVQVGRA